MGAGYNLYSDLYAKPHSHFPPGYPLLIAIGMLIDSSPTFIKFLNGLFLLASLLLVFKFYRLLVKNQITALVAVTILAFNYHLVKHSVIMLSEIPFLFFSLLTIWWLSKIDFSKVFWKNLHFYLFLVCLSFAFHIRTAGITLLGGILLFLLLEKKWKGIILTIAGFGLLAMPWMIRGWVLGLSSSYQKQLLSINPYRPELGMAEWGDFLLRIQTNFVRYLNYEIPSSLLPFIEVNYKATPTWHNWLLGGALLLLMIIGISKLRSYRFLILGYLGGTFVVLLLWPEVWFGIRFLLPLLPFMLLLLILGLSTLLSALFNLSRLAPYAPYISLLVLPLLLLYTSSYERSPDKNVNSYPLTRLKVEANYIYPHNWQRYFDMAKYAKDNLPKSAIIACRKPELFHIFSDRFTCKYPFEEDQQKLLDGLKDRQVKYVVVDQLGFSSTNRYLVPAINNNKNRFRRQLILENPTTYLLEFLSN